jgi:DNA adenine methylase
MSKLAPLLKWPGGKTKTAPRIAQYYDHSLRYVALFAGGLGDVMVINPDRVLANDCWPAVINLYNQVKTGLVPHFEMVGTPTEFEKRRLEFNQRAINCGELNSETANLLYFIQRTGHNGLVRCNKKGWSNVPHGKPDRKKWHLYKEDFSDYHKYLKSFDAYQKVFQNWEFICGDFADVPITHDDFVYADPPYDPISATGASFSYTKSFTWGDQVRLAEFLAKLDNPIVASNYATNRIVELYGNLGFNITTFETKSSISRNGGGRSALLTEMLAIKNIKTENNR